MSDVNEQSKRRRLNKKVKEFFVANRPSDLCQSFVQLESNVRNNEQPLLQVDTGIQIQSNISEQNEPPIQPYSLNLPFDSTTSTFPESESSENNLSIVFSDQNIGKLLENEKDVCFSSDNEDDIEQNIADEIAQWATKFRISLTALAALLVILRLHKLDVPKDPRTLLKTPLNYCIEQVAGGDYFYFGVEKGIISALKQFTKDFLPDITCLSLQLNVDGLPLFKSSRLQLWPILGQIKELQKIGPFVIALFSATKKPSSLQEYLAPFIDEMKSIAKNGIHIFGTIYYVEVDAVICDAPARSFLKGIKGHSGYHSCERCVQQGEWHSRLVFTDMNAQLRTDESFARMADSDHHQTVSPLTEMNFGLVSQFPLDYMHLVCLGVTRKSVFLWLFGPPKTKLPSNIVNQISSRLCSLKSHMPKDFARKPRSLSEAKMWKATEFRQFLLYTGPVVLIGKLKPAYYRNFLLLSVSIRILLSNNGYSFDNEYKKKLLHTFVKNFSSLYGKFVLSYNVHNLLHIVDDYSKFGSLDLVSCFPFENFLGNLKKMVRKPSNPISQILRRIEEKNMCCISNNSLLKSKQKHCMQHYEGPVPSGCESYSQFKQYHSSNQFFSTLPGDNCVCIGNSICVIRNILLSSSNLTCIVFSKFCIKESFSTYPFDLHLTDMFKVAKLADELYFVEVENIQYKCILLPHQTEVDYYVVMPLLHNV